MAVHVVAALEAECRAFASVIGTLTQADFDRPTNCPPWNLKELAAHVLGSTCFDAKGLRPPTAGAPIIEAADYYRRAERDESWYRQDNVRRWRSFAERFESGEQVAAVFETSWRKTIAGLRSADVSGLVGMTWQASMPLGEYVATRVIGVAAHGLDVAITCEGESWTTPEALGVTSPVLVALLGMQPPDALGWTDLDLLEVGTGRRALTDRETSALGDLARAFPLLS